MSVIAEKANQIGITDPDQIYDPEVMLQVIGVHMNGGFEEGINQHVNHAVSDVLEHYGTSLEKLATSGASLNTYIPENELASIAYAISGKMLMHFMFWASENPNRFQAALKRFAKEGAEYACYATQCASLTSIELGFQDVEEFIKEFEAYHAQGE